MDDQKPSKSAAHNNLISSPSTEPLWTVEDVARYLRLEPNTVREMARDRKLPAIKVGRVWRFRARDIKAWLEAQSLMQYTISA